MTNHALGAAYGGRFVKSDGRSPFRFQVASAVAALSLTATAWPILVAGSLIGHGRCPSTS